MKKIKIFFIISFFLMIPFVVNAETKYLYDVLKEEAESNGVAKKYTGEHHDSFTEEPSKTIYHWFASNEAEGNTVLNKNNVIFGNQCWQMFRTTDTGGVKLLYNGEAVENSCLNTRDKHTGYYYTRTYQLASNYWYGTDYEYDEATNSFVLTGEKQQTIWSDETSSDLIGKYTCRSTNEEETCSTLLWVYKYNDEHYAKVIIINHNAGYSNLGTFDFNDIGQSPAYVGYMYGDVYRYKKLDYTHLNRYTIKSQKLLSGISFSSSHYFADSFNYEGSTSNKYSLNNPYTISSDETSSLVGKYTFNSGNINQKNTWIREIIRVDNSYYYYIQLSDGQQEAPNIILGETVTDNGDNTYTLNNTISISLYEWANNYTQYKNMYICNNGSANCDMPRYITSTSRNKYEFVEVTSKILIAKNRNGLTLTDTLLVGEDLLIQNANNYNDYKYTCGNTSNVCTDSNLKYIKTYSTDYYQTMDYVHVAKSATWDGTKYILNNKAEIEDLVNITSTNYHYMCLDYISDECENAAFIFSAPSTAGLLAYIPLTNGDTVEEELDKMLHYNKTDSTIKYVIDSWYEKNLLDYSDAIDDTVFCNDRSFATATGYNFSQSNWDDSRGYDSQAKLYFRNYLSSALSTIYSDLGCVNNTDKFSVNNPDAKLTYPIALATLPEMTLFGNTTIRNVNQSYWLMSPFYYGWTSTGGGYTSVMWVVNQSGGINSSYSPYDPNYNSTIRPVISLKPGTEYISGDGSPSNPYIAKYTSYYNIDVVIKNETKELDIEIDDITSVPEGEQVTFTVTPIKGFKVNGIQIVDSSNEEIPYQTSADNQYTFIMPGEDVTIIPSYERTTAAVNVEDNPHTKEIIIEVNDATAVVYEDVVRFTVEAEEGYELVDIEITDEEGNDVEYHKTNKENEYEFIMPDTNVLIKPIYKEIPKPEEPETKPIINPNTSRSLLWIGILLALGFITRLLYKKQKMKV